MTGGGDESGGGGRSGGRQIDVRIRGGFGRGSDMRSSNQHGEDMYIYFDKDPRRGTP